VTGALRTNRELLIPCAAPYFVYVAVATLADGRLEREVDYALRIALTSAVLLGVWPKRLPLLGPRSALGSLAWGALAGALGLVLWIAALAPLSASGTGEPWSDRAFLLRLTAAVLLVPLFEEQLLRGWVLGAATQWDHLRGRGHADPLAGALDEQSVLKLEPGAFTPVAVAISCVAFALGHAPLEWPAALLYGLLMAGLRVARGDLLTCVTAHAITNLVLALYVRATAAWQLW